MNFEENNQDKIQGIKSLEHAFFILDIIKKNPNPLTLSEISNQTGMSKSRLQKYMISFIRLGALVQEKKSHTYSFGPKLLEYGLYSLRNHNIIKIDTPYLKEIKNELNKTSALNVWTPKGPVVVTSESAEGPISVSIKAGYYPPIYNSATGRCFLAFMDVSEPAVEKLMKEELQKTNLKKAEIEQEFKTIRQTGIAVRNTVHEGVPGGLAIACPVFDNTEGIIAVISIIYFSSDFSIDENSKQIKSLKEKIFKLSKDLSES